MGGVLPGESRTDTQQVGAAKHGNFLQESRERLAEVGFYRLMGTYLHGTQIPPPPDQPPVSVLPLLKIITLADFEERWCLWLLQNRVLTHLDALEDSPHSSIQQAAKRAKAS